MLRDAYTIVFSIDEMSNCLGESVLTYRQVIALGSSKVVSLIQEDAELTNADAAFYTYIVKCRRGGGREEREK